MESRKSRNKKSYRPKQIKFLICSLFLAVGIGSSINVAFANENIQLMLVNWFDKQKASSTEIIESAIMSEKEVQVKRIKEQLQKEISSAKQQLNKFTVKEKEARILAIRNHANTLMQNMSIDTAKEQTEINSQLDNILADAISRMNQVSISILPEQANSAESAEDNIPETTEQPINQPTKSSPEGTVESMGEAN